jgi:hypothetical protein
MIFLLDRAVFQQGMGKLFHKERVSGCPVEDEFPELLCDLPFLKNSLY